MMRMHLTQMQLLLDLAQTHSFNQTAERHYTTQQNISYSIKQLEQELNIKIFNRSKKGVAFTPEGRQVLQCAQQMENAYRELMENLNGEKAKPEVRDKIDLHIASVLFTTKMPGIIKAFNKRCPETKLIIKEITQETIIPSLIEHDCDIVIGSVDQRYLEKNMPVFYANDITCKLILKDNPVAVVSASSPLAAQESLSVDDLIKVSKSIFGLQPTDYYGKTVSPYILYADNNLKIHQQLLLEDNTACFTAQAIYEALFAKEKFTALPFGYPVLPLYHMIFQRKTVQDTVYTDIKNIVIQEVLQ